MQITTTIQSGGPLKIKVWQKRGRKSEKSSNPLNLKKNNGGPDGARIFGWCFGVCMGGVKSLFIIDIFHQHTLVNIAVLLKLDRKLDKFKFLY